MPCLNEAESLAYCIERAGSALGDAGIRGEVIIADNGSTDGSQDIARRHGARVVAVAEKGYGAALLGGIRAARGKYVLMGDADGSYDFTHAPRFLEKLKEGQDLVMGNRFRGGIARSAMPPLHRYLGNPVLSFVGRLFFKAPVGDFHCGLRAFRRDLVDELDLRTTGMEFASEMVVKATLQNKKINEVPTTLSPDLRSRPPHLRSFRDGWRHLRFMLLFAPVWLFLVPALVLMLLGATVMALTFPGVVHVGRFGLDVSAMLYGGLAFLMGGQAASFFFLARVYAITSHLVRPSPAWQKWMRWGGLEKGILVGLVLMIAGLAGAATVFGQWVASSFGIMMPWITMRYLIPSVVLILAGFQLVLVSFLLSIMFLRYEERVAGRSPVLPV